MFGYVDKVKLIAAVREGNPEKVRHVINSVGLSYLSEWSEGYVLLCDAIEHKHKEVAKLLLDEGVPVNSKIKRKSCDTPLHFAVHNGYTDLVQLLLSRHAIVNTENGHGMIPLHIAVTFGNEEICHLLLRKNSFPNSRDRNGDEPLHIAAKQGYLGIAKDLIIHGACVNSPCKSFNQEDYTPLHHATCNGHGEIVKLLLENGAVPNSKGKDDRSSLYLAAEKGYLGIAKDLIMHGACINSSCTSFNQKGYTPLHHATSKNHGEIVKLLLESGADPNSKGKDDRTSLHLAVEKGYFGIAKDLIMHGACVNLSCTSPNQEGYTLLHLATCNGHGEIVKLLLENGTVANSQLKDGSTSLHLAAEKGHLGIAEDLIRLGACVNSSLTSSNIEGYTPLHYASRNGNEEVVQLLLDKEATINAPAKNDLKPLHVAVQERQEKIVKLLLDHGADVDSKDKDGKTPLYIAVAGECLAIIQDILKHCPDVNDKYNKLAFNSAIHKQREIIEMFLNYGFRIDPKDAKDHELLQICVEKGFTRIVEDLLHYGANVNTPYSETWRKGYTLLHTAATKGHTEIARILINYGANVNAKDKCGRTPIYYSITGGSSEITKLLVASGINVNDVFETGLNHDVFENALFENNFHSNSWEVPGETALHLAVMKGNKEITNLLLSKRANVNAIKVDGSTALHIAVVERNKEIVILLLEHNVNVNTLDKRVLSPLHYACTNKTWAIARTLLDYGADVNCKGKWGETVLHYLCRNEDLEGVENLLEYGADINATNNHGITPLSIAFANKRGYSYDSDDNSKDVLLGLKDIDRLIIKHIVKMKAANMHVSDKNQKYNNLLSCFQNRCEEEIKEMKNEKISGNISFFDLLIKPLNQVAAYERNESIARVLDSEEYKTKFPIYAKTLERHVARGRKKKELLECVSKALNYFFKSILPFPVTQKILHYLGEKDLRNLTKFYEQHIDSPNTDMSNTLTEGREKEHAE